MNRSVAVIVFAFALSGCFALPVGAQDDVRPPAPTVAPPLIVTATRIEQEADASGSSVSVIDADEIRARQHDEVQETLRSAPGIQVVRIGTRGAQTTLSVRGGETDHTLVLLDGFQINEDGGFFDWDRMSTDGIGHVEIVRGAGSAPHGSDALSGTVNLVLRRGAGTPTAAVSFEGGTYTTFRERLDLQGEVGKLHFSGVASHLSQRDGRFNHSDLEKENFVGRFDFDFSADTSVKFDVLQVRDRTQLYGNSSGPSFGPEDPDARAGEDVMLFGLEGRHRFAKWVEARVAVSRMRQSPTFKDEGDPADAFGYYRQASEFIRDTLDVSATFIPIDTDWLRLESMLGFEAEVERVHTHSRFFDFGVFDYVRAEFKEDRDNRAVYLSNIATLFERVTLEFSGRWDDNSFFGDARTARVAGSYLHKETGTRPHASWGKGIKEPTFFESFDPQFGTPGLTPEIGRTWDAGIEQTLWEQKVKLDATYFSNRIDNLIQFRSLAFFPVFLGDYVNAGKAHNDGVEVSGTIQPIEAITLRGAWTHLNTEVVESNDPTDPSFRVGEPLLRRPENLVSAGITARPWQHLTLDLAYLHVGHRDDRSFVAGRPARETVSGYHKFDFAASYQFEFGLRLFGVVENFTDAEFEEALGFPAEGINAMGGVGYELEF